MLEDKKQIYIKQFFNIICINNIIMKTENDELEDKTDNNKNKAVNILKINIKTIIDRLKDLKQNLPDLLNTTEANQALFKINKYNELFNPLDECLQFEIDHFNKFITNLEDDINCLLNVLKGEMVLIDKYHEMIKCINKNIIPREWSLSKYPSKNKEIKIDDWIKKIKKIYDFLNNWIYEGYSKVYNLSYLSNERLFLTLLPIYFQKKLPEGKISSDKVKLHFKLTKYEKEEDITEEIMDEFKKNNNNNDFIFIKGLRLRGFDGYKEEDREIKTFKETDNKERNELLPIVVITYIVEDYQYEIANPKEESEEEEDEDEEEINMNQEVKEENKNENPQPSGSGPKDDEQNEEEKGDDNKEENNDVKGEKEEKEENEQKEENEKKIDIEPKKEDNESQHENNKEDPNQEPKDNINKNEDEKKEQNDNVGDKKQTENTQEEVQKEKETKEDEKEKKEENEENKGQIEVQKKLVVEETTVKTKKMEFLETMSNMKNKKLMNEVKEATTTKIVRTKVRYYKKHCRLEVPFIEEQDPNTYNINEPYGYIELRFDCERDKQEEYFQNKRLAIELDK